MSKKKKRYSKRKKKNIVRPQEINYNAVDFHHYNFIARNWSQGWAKVLRSHPYAGAYIPKLTLHKEIHFQIWTVPVPKNEHCRLIVRELDEGLRAGTLSLADAPEVKMRNLIEICEKYDKKTAAVLKRQEAIMLEFYGK